MGFEQITGPNYIAPTPPAGDISNRQATTAFVQSAVATAIATPALAAITNSLSSDHGLTNISSYFDGPSVAQGSSGTWFASGTVTLTDTSAAGMRVKLWDGSTIIASANASCPANSTVAVSLSGFLASPAGNLTISVRDITNTTGKILFNMSANSMDSTITAIRIG
jgi:hypothetical protein